MSRHPMLPILFSFNKLVLSGVIAVIAIGLLSTPSLGRFISGGSGGEGGGGGGDGTVWEPSPSQSTMCTRAGKICAEWIVEDRTEWVCCLDFDKLFSADLGACPSPRRPQY